MKTVYIIHYIFGNSYPVGITPAYTCAGWTTDINDAMEFTDRSECEETLFKLTKNYPSLRFKIEEIYYYTR